MATYVAPDPEVIAVMRRQMEAHHTDLVEAGVTVGVLMAHAARDKQTGEPKGPAIKHAGYPALALVSVVSLKDRVAGLPDARIIVDGDRWEELTAEQRDAVFDHELEHLLLIRDESGAIQLDDAFRPRLKLRPHDFQMGAFVSVIQRHKGAAIEAQSFAEMHRTLAQLELFPVG